MERKDKKTFKNEEELKQFCKKSLKDVGKLGDYKDTKHNEQWTFFRFIEYSINNPSKPFWTYPVTIIYDDRPDFIIEYADERVSAEVTSQKAERWRWAESIKQNLGGNFEGLIGAKEKEYTKPDIERMDPNSTLPSTGNNPEKYWIERTIYTTTEKHKKATKYPEIDDFSSNILLIFDLVPEAVMRHCLTEGMFNDLEFYQQCSKTLFDRVVCIDGGIIDIDLKNKRFEYYGEYEEIFIMPKDNGLFSLHSKKIKMP